MASHKEGKALVFLNGFYDYGQMDFYLEVIEKAGAEDVLVCADGGVRIFQKIREKTGKEVRPYLVMGDFDTAEPDRNLCEHWEEREGEEYTDGQMVMDYVVGEGYRRIEIFGGLPRENNREMGHSLGNLRLMGYGFEKSRREENYRAAMRGPRQDVHFVHREVGLERKGNGKNMVSIIPVGKNVVVRKTEGLEWELEGSELDFYSTRTLRNVFSKDADRTAVKLEEGSDPVYVVHNW